MHIPTYRYRYRFALTIVGLVLSGGSSACEIPAGFIVAPRPNLAPLESLLSRTEEIDVARPFSAPPVNRPLEEAIRATRDLPGVAGTRRLSTMGYGSVGSRRLVCLTDGSTAVEQVLLTESGENSRRFRYVVWNYSSEKKRDIDHAIGEIVSTKLPDDNTHVAWTYRYALKSGLSAEARETFQKVFLHHQMARWMRSQLERGRDFAEKAR